MTETMTITQMIAEEKHIKVQIMNLINSDFELVTHCLKNSQYVGPRSKEEQEKHQKETFQSLNDLMRRLRAIKKAHTKANHDTMVEVPCEPDFLTFINGEELGTEMISIAEAINRKNSYKGRGKVDNTNYSYSFLAQKLVALLNSDLHEKAEFDEKARREVNEQMARKFPSDSKSSWSQDKYNEERKKEEAAVEVLRIDPLDLVNNQAIQKYYNAINDYIVRIDSLLSEVNASTKITFEY